ncbi:MAG: hypothetical protein JSW07_07745 [bacterium]|nr:MAG: hypothetical protein JSW07_07745 [bacterium]
MDKSKKHEEKKSTKAYKKIKRAAYERLKAQYSRGYHPGVAEFHEGYAQDLEEDADELLKPNYEVKIGTGKEAFPDPEDRIGIRETMEDPDMINLDASTSRLDRLADLDVLAVGLDLSQSIQVKNSLEQMLAHQMSAAHNTAMKLLAKTQNIRDTADISRLTNASARLMGVFQEAAKTIQKLRTGGRQKIIVQHIKVGDNAQAMVAGNMKTGGAKDGGENAN